MQDNVEIERKFIIERPDFEAISRLTDYTKSEICQVYIASARGISARVRRRAYSDRVVYTKTEKVRISDMSARELECEITEQEYDRLALSIEKGTRPIFKIRHTFSHSGKTVEIDEYPFFERTCILEVELSSESEELTLPDFIRVIAEKTGDKAYSNHSMARLVPREIYL